jgi:hypothetical protein
VIATLNLFRHGSVNRISWIVLYVQSVCKPVGGNDRTDGTCASLEVLVKSITIHHDE